MPILTHLPLVLSILSILALGLLMIANWPEERRLKVGMIIVALYAVALMFNQNI